MFKKQREEERLPGFLTKKRKKLEHFIEERLDMSMYDYVDHCEEYRFDHFADAIRFNERFNEPGMESFLDIDCTSDILSDMAYTISINSNIIFMVYGPRNMAKSEIAQALGFYWTNQCKIIKGWDSIVEVSFNDSEMTNVFKKLNSGDIAIRDESPKTAGKGARITKDKLGNICNITRGYQVSFIFVNPQRILVNGIDYYIEVAGKNIMTRTNRCLLYDREHNLVGVIYLKMHDNQKFREDYEARKKANIKLTMLRSGLDMIHVDGEELMRSAQKLAEFCKTTLSHKKKYYKSDLRAQIPVLNALLPKEQMVGGPGDYNDNLISLSINILENPDIYKTLKMRKTDEEIDAEEKEKIEGTLSHDITEKAREIGLKTRKMERDDLFIDYEKLAELNLKSFSDYCKMRIKRENVSFVTAGIARGDSYDTIASNGKGKIEYSTVQNIGMKVRKNKGEYRIGDLFVEYIALCKLNIPPDKVDKCISRIGQKGPDIIWDGEFYSCKFRSNISKKTDSFLQKGDLNPEYTQALKLKKDYYLIYYNAKWELGDFIVKKRIDPFSSNKIYLAKPFKKMLDMGTKGNTVFNDYVLF